jgi:hypothetical protein
MSNDVLPSKEKKFKKSKSKDKKVVVDEDVKTSEEVNVLQGMLIISLFAGSMIKIRQRRGEGRECRADGEEKEKEGTEVAGCSGHTYGCGS